MATTVEPRTRASTTLALAPAAAPRRARTPLALGLVAIALGLATMALLGPLLTGVIDYHVTETLRHQTIGLDAVSLLLAAPLGIGAALLVLRDHPGGPALALGIGSYTSYMLAQYILGPDYERLPGNNELLFPLTIALFTLGWVVALLAWQRLDTALPPRTRRRDRLVGTLLLPVLAAFAFLRYLPALADWMSASPEDAGYLAGPTFAWTIVTLDLGVFLPATVATCVGLVRRAPWAAKALYLISGWFGLVGTAVAAMAIAMYLGDDPTTSGGNALFLTALGLAFAAFALLVFLPLFRTSSGTGSRARAHYPGLGLVLGSGLGLLLGALFGSGYVLLVGLFTGAAAGLLAGAIVEQRPNGRARAR